MGVLCEITPYISNIATDDELLGELRAAIKPGEDATRGMMILLVVEKINKIVPVLLEKHKADVFGIIAALNGKTPEKIAKQNILVTMAQIREIVKDKELLDFFRSCADSEESE
jgi:hypothetical protein